MVSGDGTGSTLDPFPSPEHICVLITPPGELHKLAQTLQNFFRTNGGGVTNTLMFRLTLPRKCGNI